VDTDSDLDDDVTGAAAAARMHAELSAKILYNKTPTFQDQDQDSTQK